MKLKDIHNIYFIGIGGIGMSALARYFKLLKKNVAGYDKTETPFTREISDLGIEIHYADDISEIPAEFKNAGDTMKSIRNSTPQM